MTKHPRAQYLWSLALPIALAVLISVRAPVKSPAPTDHGQPLPTTGPSPIQPAEPIKPSAPAPLLPLPAPPITVPLPPVIQSPGLIPGALPEAQVPANPPTSPTTSTEDPRITAIQQQVRDGSVDQAEAKLRQLAKGGDPVVAAHAQFVLGQTMLMNGDASGGQQTFRDYLAAYPSGKDAARIRFGLGELAFQKGQRDQASGYFQEYLKTTDDHALDGYVYSALAQIATANGDSTTNVSMLQRAVEAGLPISDELKAASAVGDSMLRSGNASAAADWYATLAARPSDDSATRAHYEILQASALQRTGDTKGAVAIYGRLVADGTAGIDTGSAITALKSLGQPVSAFAAGEAFLKAGQFASAVQSLGDYLDQNPNGSDGATARYDRGRALMSQNDYAAAAAQLDRFIATYPNDSRLGAAALLEGQSLGLAGNTSQAVQFLQTFAQQHPSDASAPQALANAVEYLKKDSQNDAALQIEKDLMASFPNSSAAPAAAFDVGWADYENLDFAAAKSVWQSVRDRWPTAPGSSPALLWLGKIEQRDGNTAAAQHDFQLAWQANPGDYYAFRARELAAGSATATANRPLVQPTASELAKEKSDFETWLATWTKPPASDRGKPYLGAAVSQGSTLNRIHELAAIGLQDELQSEIKQAMGQYANDGRSLYALADVLNQSGLTSESLAAAYRLLMISPAPNAYQSPVYLQRLVYPFPYRDLIVQSAQKFGVDPLLLVSLIRQESTFDTRARSSTNALGLTQFMPATAQGVAAQIGLSNFNLDDLYQPPTAIELGAAYLANQTRAFGGNPYFALAAYNAGGGNVLNWLSDNPRHDLDLLAEEIPFKQTYDYVRNIYRYYQEYQFIYRTPNGH